MLGFHFANAFEITKFVKLKDIKIPAIQYLVCHIAIYASYYSNTSYYSRNMHHTIYASYIGRSKLSDYSNV